jgi:hemerythrin
MASSELQGLRGSGDSSTDVPELGVEFMDRDHVDFIALVDRLRDLLQSASDDAMDALNSAVQSLLSHSEEHFAREEEAMQAAGFPPYPVHKAEHERVLARLREVLVHWQACRDQVFLAAFVEGELLDWFDQHLQTMDQVTAAFLSRS